MKKLLLAAVLAATTAAADAAVTFQFTGTDTDNAAVSGSVTIDTDAIGLANGATPPALDYYFATGDASSSVATPFLSISFASAGATPTLLSAGDYTYQTLHADPSDGSLALELDWQRANADATLTSSRFTLSGFTLTGTSAVGGVLLPDFGTAGDVYFDAASGTGAQETYDVESAGTLSFAAAAPAPEVATWISMVAGFGLTGAALRRRAARPLAA